LPMDAALLGMHDPLPEGNVDWRDKRHQGHDERGRWEMSATMVRPKASDEEPRMLAEETRLATRATDFEELFRELVEESGRALEEGYLEWCAVLQGYLIPKIDAECLRARGAGP
jgi:hypothetical protein